MGSVLGVHGLRGAAADADADEVENLGCTVSSLSLADQHLVLLSAGWFAGGVDLSRQS